MSNSTADHRRGELPLLPFCVLVSAIILLFSAWGLLDQAGLWAGEFDARGASVGWAFFAALAAVSQFVANLAAVASRRAAALGEMEKDRRAALWVAAVYVLVNAMALHNAFDRTGMFEGDSVLGALAWVVSIMLPISELRLWTMDESLKSRAAILRQLEEDDALSGARPRVTFADMMALDPAGLDLVSDAAFLRDLRGRAMSIGAKATHRIGALEAGRELKASKA